MLALPTIICLMLGIPFVPLVASSVGLFMMGVLFAWMLSIGLWSNQQLPANKQRSIQPFIAGLTFPIIYLLMYIFLYIPQLANGGPAKPPLWMLPMHMLSLVGYFYGIWFTASQLKSLLESHNENYMIFSNTFFLLFIFPIGIWLIQPGVNRLHFNLQQSGLESNED